MIKRTITITLEFDSDADAAYLRFAPPPLANECRLKSVPVENRLGEVYGALDLAGAGEGGVVGLEILNASERLPEAWLEGDTNEA